MWNKKKQIQGKTCSRQKNIVLWTSGMSNIDKHENLPHFLCRVMPQGLNPCLFSPYSWCSIWSFKNYSPLDQLTLTTGPGVGVEFRNLPGSEFNWTEEKQHLGRHGCSILWRECGTKGTLHCVAFCVCSPMSFLCWSPKPLRRFSLLPPSVIGC